MTVGSHLVLQSTGVGTCSPDLVLSCWAAVPQLYSGLALWTLWEALGLQADQRGRARQSHGAEVDIDHMGSRWHTHLMQAPTR